MDFLLNLVIIALFVGSIVFSLRRQKRRAEEGDQSWRHPAVQRWLQQCAQALSATLEKPFRNGEFGQLAGTTADGISWRIRVVSGFHTHLVSDAAFDVHHLFWSTDALRTEQVLGVLGDGVSDVNAWRLLPGLTPDEQERRTQATLAYVDEAAERFEKQRKAQGGEVTLGQAREALAALAGAFPIADALERSDVASGRAGESRRKLREMQAQEGLPFAPGEMEEFAESARRVRLDPALVDARWYAFATDDAAERALRAPEVRRLLAEWTAKHCKFKYGGFFRAWIGGPNLRIEVYDNDLSQDAYRCIVELGAELARGYLAAAGGAGGEVRGQEITP